MKKRTVFAILGIIILCVAGFLVWYGISTEKKPVEEIVVDDSDKMIYDSLYAAHGQKEYHFSEITVDNAVDAIGMIEPAERFYAVFTAENFSDNRTVMTQSKVWKNMEKYRTESEGNLNKTCICDGNRIKIINEDRETYAIYPVGENFTYAEEIGVTDIEYILENAENEILSARFARTAGIQSSGNIIFAEFYDKATDCREEFYISFDYGIILSARTFIGDEMIYRFHTNEFVDGYVSDGTMFTVREN